MKKNFVIVSALVTSAILAACSEIPKEAYYTHGQPEDLMVKSKQTSHFVIADKNSVKEILHWAEVNKPTEAALHCRETSRTCNKIEQVLERGGVATTRSGSSGNTVTFTYEQVTARACENRYIDNMINPYNLNHPTYGCSISSNIAMMVTDKKDITDPRIADPMDARKGVQAYDNYNTASKTDTSFAPISTTQSLATNSGGGR